MATRRALVGESLVLIGIRVAGVFLQFLVIVLVARMLSLEEMGLYALFYASAGIARAAGPIGIDQASTRLIAMSSSIVINSQRISDLSKAGFLLVGTAAFSFAALTALAMALGSELVSYSWVEAFLFVATMPAFVGIGLLLGQLRGLGYNLWAQVPDALGLHLIVLTIAVPLAVMGHLTLFTAMLALALSGWITLTMQILVRLRIGIPNFERPNAATVRELFKESWQIFQAHAVTTGIQYAPMMVAAIVLGPRAVAILEIAQRFGNMPTLLSASVGATYSPIFARLSAEGDSSRLKRVTIDAGLLAGIPSIIYTLLIAFLGNLVVGIFFPSDYVEAVVPMIIVAAGSAVNATLGTTSYVQLMAGGANTVLLYSLFGFAIVSIGSLLLGLSFGIIGVAISILLGRIMRDGGIAIYTFRSMRQ